MATSSNAFPLRAHVRLCVWVPVEKVGLVIGKHRKSLFALKRDSQVLDIWFPTPEQIDEDTLWGEINLLGLPSNVFSAFESIETIVRGEVDDVVLNYIVERSRRPLLLGPKYSTLKNISADSGARIHIPDPSDSSDTVQIEGSYSNVKKAFSLIEDTLSSGPKSKVVISKIQVPSSKLGAIIGSNGKTLSAIKNSTGAMVRFAQKERGGDTKEGDEEKELTITGTPDSVALASEAIKHMTDMKYADAMNEAINALKKSGLLP